MPAIFQYWSQPLSEFSGLLARLRGMGADLTPLMEEIAGILGSATEDAFANQADPTTGQAWPVLSEARIEAREKKGSWPGKILQDDGILASSVLTSAGHDYAEIGSNMIYAATHQNGRGAIPRRAFLGAGPEHEQEILGTTAAFIDSLTASDSVA